MTLLDLFTNPANLSTIIEFVGLVGTIYLFFRKANEDNIKQVSLVKEDLIEARVDMRDRLDNTEKRICQRVTEVKLEVDKLRDNFFAHIASGRTYSQQYSSNPLSNVEKEIRKNGNNNHH